VLGEDIMKIAVVGLGHAGLVIGACLAEMGHDVACVDCDAEKVDKLKTDRLPLYEPGLSDLVKRGKAAGRLSFGGDLASAAAHARMVFIAVSTADSNDDGKPDPSAVFSITRRLVKLLNGYCMIAMASAVPVGTGDAIEKILAARLPRESFDVVSNPQFLREGRAIHDFFNPDRIVVGAESVGARALMAQFYTRERFGAAPILYTDRRSAEMTKYAATAFVAAKVAFINDIAELCERAGADVEHVSRGMGLDLRIGRECLRAGPGFGGSCLPKDTRVLVQMAQDCGAPYNLFDAIVTANRVRQQGLVKRVIAACGGSVAGREIAVLGLTFKAHTDDVRESPALSLIAALQANGAHVHAYDPAGMTNAARVLPDVTFAEDPYACAAGAHAVVLATDWLEFRQLDLHRLRDVMAEAVIVDLRNMYNPAEVADHGLAYVSVGRPAVWPKRTWRRFVSMRRPRRELSIVSAG
jgi:UDPglucose 6-dehydrogenase